MLHSRAPAFQSADLTGAVFPARAVHRLSRCALLSSRVVELAVYLALVAAATVSFCITLVEATYLTVKRPPLLSMEKGGSRRAGKALKITGEKAKLVSVTTFID